MAARAFGIRIATASLLLASICSRSLGQGVEPPGGSARHTTFSHDTREQRLYPVADLVLPMSQPGECNLYNLVKPIEPPKKSNAKSPEQTKPGTVDVKPDGAPMPVKTIEDDLIKTLTATIEPEKWEGRGGSWTLVYHADTKTLVVNAPAKTQEKVEALLSGLRRQQNQEVCVELRLISTSDAMMERLGLTSSGEEKPSEFRSGAEGRQMPFKEMVQGISRVTFLNAAQVAEFTKLVQQDPRTSVMQAPKMTLLNSQAAKFTCADVAHFVTKVDPRDVGGQKIYVPLNEMFPVSGYSFSLQPAISADRRFVSLNLQANLTKLQSESVPLYPVTTLITPTFEGGAIGQPVPFTQHLQQPSFNTIHVDRRLNIPDGGTALLSGWHQVNIGRTEFGPPVLGSIPYVGRLFTNVSITRENVNVMLMVTPHIIVGPEPEETLAQDKARLQGSSSRAGAGEPETVQALLANYRKACSEGRTAEARELAAKALSLDPACFTNR